ncbi:MAG TPA: CopD family protein [Steroidobacteraceae bacterium]
MEVSGWDAAAVCAKAVTYAASLGAGGAVFFLIYCHDLLQASQVKRIQRLIAICIVTAAAASIVKILLLTGSMSGNFAGMLDSDFAGMILKAGEGTAGGVRFAGLALTLFALSSNYRSRVPAVAGAIIASTSFVWVGHIHGLIANTVPGVLLCLHLLCAAFWLGALAPLLIVVRDGNDSQIAAVGSRFGKLALSVVAALLAVGLSLLWILIANAAEFWASNYARMMLIKLIAVACLIAIAAGNKLYLTPRLLNRNSQAVALFRRAIQTEIFFAALILLTTAAFTTIAGPPK